MTIRNSKYMPARYYGLHICEGVAEYTPSSGGDNYRILVLENALKNMDQTYEGKPVYIKHVDKVNLDKLQEEAAGYVVKSFYNKSDGKHWVEFIVVSDEAHEKIKQGWTLSNAYRPKEISAGGKWHNVDYKEEIISGEYEHLAIVPDPRYTESIILTPDQFKEYNTKKEKELSTLQNSQGESQMGFFTKKKIENSVEIEATMVTLKNGKDMTIKEIINSYNEMMEEKKKNEEEKEKMKDKPTMADESHHVMVDDEMMTINELKEKYMELKSPKEEEKEEMAEEKKEEPKKNEEEEKEEHKEKKENSKEKDKKHKEAIKNAHLDATDEVEALDLTMDQVARGKARYGSKK